MLTIDGRSAPIVVCDYCGKRIDNARMAAAVFQPASESAEVQPVLHVHKGSCHDKADTMCGDRGGGHWVELERHLLQLLSNSGVDEERFRLLLEQDGQLGGLP